MEEPKKKRRLLIIDVESDTPYVPAAAKPPPPEPVVLTPGVIHGNAQKEVLRMCKEARFNEEKIEDRIWIRLDEVLKAKTVAEAHVLVEKALESAQLYFTLNRKHPEKQAKAAERIAEMYRRKGEDEKADKQLAKAKKIRAEIRAEAQVRKP